MDELNHAKPLKVNPRKQYVLRNECKAFLLNLIFTCFTSTVLEFIFTNETITAVKLRRAGSSHLPAEVSVVHVTHKQRLGGESVRLDVNIGSGHLTGKKPVTLLATLKAGRWR